jgi:methionyl-tRNA formyltransferase
MQEKTLNTFFDACENGDLAKVLEVIDKVENINSYNDLGRNAIIMAAFNHHVSIVKLLLDNGAYINSINKNGTTVFMYAKTKVLDNNNYSFLDFLLSNGAKINLKDYKNNWTVLDYVKELKHDGLINYLINKGAE